jgi:hypothetical protein
MNAIRVLEAQQGDLEDLFHEIAGAKDAPTKRQILDEIADKLALQAACEEHVLRRASAASPAAREVLRARLRRAEALAAELRRDRGEDVASTSAKLAALEEEIERQADEVETEVLPRLAAFAEDQLWLLGVELAAIRRAFELRAANDSGPVRSAA